MVGLMMYGILSNKWLWRIMWPIHPVDNVSSHRNILISILVQGIYPCSRYSI
jgi:hypothetical protein